MSDAPVNVPQAMVLKGREVGVGVCGGIAAYKVADLVSKMVQLGPESRLPTLAVCW